MKNDNDNEKQASYDNDNEKTIITSPRGQRLTTGGYYSYLLH